jgi:hypothetical protein
LPGRSSGAVKNRWYAALKQSTEPFAQGLASGERVEFE